MTKSEFLAIKTSGKLIPFSKMIDFKAEQDTGILKDFIKHMHPNADTIPESDRIRVFTKNNTYSYLLGTWCIVRICIKNGRTEYKWYNRNNSF